MNDTSILGIDVAKEKVDVVLARGDKTQRRTFGNTPTGHGKLWQWLTRHGATTCHACMEATGVYSQQLAVFLHERKVKVSVVNPVRIKGFLPHKVSSLRCGTLRGPQFRQGELGRTKTDEADAALIARWSLPSRKRGSSNEARVVGSGDPTAQIQFGPLLTAARCTAAC